MGVDGTAITSLIMLVVGVAIGSTLVVATWTSTLRPNLYNMLNDSNFTGTWGVGMRDAGILFLDVIPLLIGLAFLVIMSTVFVKKVTSIAR